MKFPKYVQIRLFLFYLQNKIQGQILEEEGNRKNGIECWLTLHHRPGKIAITEQKRK